MKPKKYLRRGARIFLGSIAVLCLMQAWFVWSTSDQIVRVDDADESYDVALVLGAGVYSNQTPTPILRDRLDTAVQLYKLGMVSRLLVSGDNKSVEYNEVHTMSKYLLSQGIPASQIFQDYAGFDTYDSIYRAREIFQVEKMLIVTQQFHLPRAVAIANSLGFQTQGVIADRHDYEGHDRMQLREVGARVKARGEIVRGSESKYGGEVIDIQGESNTTSY